MDVATSPVTQGELDGRKFLLEMSRGFERVAGTEIELGFVDGWLNLYADCNGQGGRYEIQSSALLLTDFGTNQIACRPELHAQDEWLAEFFSSRPGIGRNGDRLILAGASAKLGFLANPDQPLVGAAWQVDALIVADRPSTVPRPTDPSITFRPDGTLEVDTSCNAGHGDYVASTNRITLSNLTYTEQACVSPDSFSDGHVKAIMTNGAVAFAIDGRRLTIERGNLGLHASRAR